MICLTRQTLSIRFENPRSCNVALWRLFKKVISTVPHFTFKKVQDSKGLHWYPWPHHGASCEQLCWCRFAPPLPFSLGRCIWNRENPPSPRYLTLYISVIYSPAPMCAHKLQDQQEEGRVWEERHTLTAAAEVFKWNCLWRWSMWKSERGRERERAREEMIMTRCQIEIQYT